MRREEYKDEGRNNYGESMDQNALSINQMRAIVDSAHYRVDESKRKQTVCVHWLKGTCKKGSECEFLHSYDKERIPRCKWYDQEGRCAKGEECYYRHIS